MLLDTDVDLACVGVARAFRHGWRLWGCGKHRVALHPICTVGMAGFRAATTSMTDRGAQFLFWVGAVILILLAVALYGYLTGAWEDQSLFSRSGQARLTHPLLCPDFPKCRATL